MDNQNEVQDGSKSSKVNNCNKTCLKTVFSLFGVFVIALCSAAYISNKNQQINIDTSIPAFNSSLNEYKECNSKESCKKEDEKKLLNTLVDIENIYSRDFYSAGKLLEKAEKDKFNSFTKDTINSLVDMKKYGETISLISFSSEYIKPEETKQEIKTIYENRSSLNIVDLFGLSRILKDNGYYLESTTLSMSIPDHIAIATSRKLMDTFLLFGCRDDLLVWGSYYSKLIPDLFLRDETQYLSKQEYFKLIRSVDSDTLDKINKTSSDMVLLKKYPDLSANCQVKRFSLYN